MESKTKTTKQKQGRKSRAELEKIIADMGGVVSDQSAINRRNLKRYAMIDDEINTALLKINKQRREECEKDIIKWINTYCVPTILDDSPPPKCEEIIRTMLESCLDNKPFLIQQSRGSGKTSFIECVTCYLLALGIKKFVVIIASNQNASQTILNDIFRLISEPDSAFAVDYPEINLPYSLMGGSYRKTQTYNGKVCNVVRNASKIQFARLEDENNNPFPCSESCIETRGFTSSIRGIKGSGIRKRPDLVIIDDIETEEIASSSERIQKTLTIINKSILNLGKSGEKISVLFAGTPIEQDDVVCRISEDKNWKTSKFPAIIKFPNDWFKPKNESLWSKYFGIYDSENATDKSHEQSLQFYKDNQEKMDDGSEVLNPKMFDPQNGTVSAIQALLDKQHQIGNSAFMSEYQMSPKHTDLEIQIKPKDVFNHISEDFEEFETPEQVQLTVATIDINSSYGFTITVCCFRPDGTCFVIAHKIISSQIDQKLVDLQYQQAVYGKLCDVVQEIKSWNIDIDALGIDAGGKNFDAVVSFSKSCPKLFGIPCIGMIGRSSLNFNPLSKSRLRSAIGKTLLCGDEIEHQQKNKGKKYLLFDSDYFRTEAQKSFLLEKGNVGSTSIFNGTEATHQEFAIQFCNETLLYKRQKPYGIEYVWKSKEKHDYLDCMSMAFALCQNQNIGIGSNVGGISQQTDGNKQNLRREILLKLLKNTKKPKLQ